jgi:hypothetical protein
VIDITAHRCVTTVSSPNPTTSPTDTTGPARKISLTGSSKYIFKVVPPAPGTSRAVTFTPQKIHIFSAENETEFRGWVEALMKANIGLDSNGTNSFESTNCSFCHNFLYCSYYFLGSGEGDEIPASCPRSVIQYPRISFPDIKLVFVSHKFRRRGEES